MDDEHASHSTDSSGNNAAPARPDLVDLTVRDSNAQSRTCARYAPSKLPMLIATVVVHAATVYPAQFEPLLNAAPAHHEVQQPDVYVQFPEP